MANKKLVLLASIFLLIGFVSFVSAVSPHASVKGQLASAHEKGVPVSELVSETYAAKTATSSITTTATIVSACGTWITSPGNYELASDLDCVDGNVNTLGIRIASTYDVVLDCKGYKIRSDGFNGVILVSRSNGVTVKNCVTESYGVPSSGYPLSNNLFSAESQNVRFIDNNVLGEYEGITLRNTKDSLVENNNVKAAIGIVLFGSGTSWGPLWNVSGNIVKNNVVSASNGIGYYGRYAIWLSGQYFGSSAEPNVQNNIIEGNCLSASGGYYVDSSNQNVYGEDYSILLWGGALQQSEQNNIIKGNNLNAAYTVFDSGYYYGTTDDNVWSGNYWNPLGWYFFTPTVYGLGIYSGDTGASSSPVKCGPVPPCLPVIEGLQSGNTALKAIDSACCVKKVDSRYVYDDPDPEAEDSHGDYVSCVALQAKTKGFTGKTVPSKGEIVNVASQSNINMPLGSSSKVGPTGYVVSGESSNSWMQTVSLLVSILALVGVVVIFNRISSWPPFKNR